jgi:hypothetical protein
MGGGGGGAGMMNPKRNENNYKQQIILQNYWRSGHYPLSYLLFKNNVLETVHSLKHLNKKHKQGDG